MEKHMKAALSGGGAGFGDEGSEFGEKLRFMYAHN